MFLLFDVHLGYYVKQYNDKINKEEESSEQLTFDYFFVDLLWTLS